MNYFNRWLACTLVYCAAQSGYVTADEAKITVMNPRGIQPAIQRIPMAARTGGLDGKTVFIVDTKYPNTKPFVNTLRDNLAANYPKTTWVNKDKTGNYMEDDPALWTEIKEKAHAAIVLIGH
jgi:hypothetical protein